VNPRELHSNYNTKPDVFVLIGEQRHRLMEYNREWLLTSPHPEELPEGHSVTARPQQLTNGEH